jgi:hypothetical protein
MTNCQKNYFLVSGIYFLAFFNKNYTSHRTTPECVSSYISDAFCRPQISKWDISDASEIIVRTKLTRMSFCLCSTCQGNNNESLTDVMQHVLPVWQCVFISAYIMFIYVRACLYIFSIANLY